MTVIYLYYWSHVILSRSNHVILFQICFLPRHLSLFLFLFLTSSLSNFYFAFLLYRPEGYCRVYLSANIIASRVVPTILGMIQDKCLFHLLSALLIPVFIALSQLLFLLFSIDNSASFSFFSSSLCVILNTIIATFTDCFLSIQSYNYC